eukprot:scaffold69296_cov21-Tisochrysis_lutea.AAC.1
MSQMQSLMQSNPALSSMLGGGGLSGMGGGAGGGLGGFDISQMLGGLGGAGVWFSVCGPRGSAQQAEARGGKGHRSNAGRAWSHWWVVVNLLLCACACESMDEGALCAQCAVCVYIGT